MLKIEKNDYSNPGHVLQLYKDKGLIARICGLYRGSLTYETTTALTDLLSATYIKQDLPIRLINPSSPGLIYHPDLIHVAFAFPGDAFVSKSVPMTRGSIEKTKKTGETVRKAVVVMEREGKKDYYRDFAGESHNVEGIRDKLQKRYAKQIGIFNRLTTDSEITIEMFMENHRRLNLSNDLRIDEAVIYKPFKLNEAPFSEENKRQIQIAIKESGDKLREVGKKIVGLDLNELLIRSRDSTKPSNAIIGVLLGENEGCIKSQRHLLTPLVLECEKHLPGRLYYVYSSITGLRHISITKYLHQSIFDMSCIIDQLMASVLEKMTTHGSLPLDYTNPDNVIQAYKTDGLVIAPYMQSDNIMNGYISERNNWFTTLSLENFSFLYDARQVELAEIIAETASDIDVSDDPFSIIAMMSKKNPTIPARVKIRASSKQPKDAIVGILLNITPKLGPLHASGTLANKLDYYNKTLPGRSYYTYDQETRSVRVIPVAQLLGEHIRATVRALKIIDPIRAKL